MKKDGDYYEFLAKELRDDKFATAYLNSYLEEGDKEMFLWALQHVAAGRGGIVNLAIKTKLNRPHLYKMLSKQGNPEIETLFSILDSLGLRLAVLPKTRKLRKKESITHFKKAA